MVFNIKTITALALLFISSQCYAFGATLLEQKILAVKQTLNVNISYEKNIIDSWKGVTYQMCEESEMIKYLDMMMNEYCKYPAGYLTKTGIHTIILTRNLKFEKQARAAVPDPYKGQLYLSVNGAYGVSSKRYLVHVMHHELHHCTEYALWKNMTYDWCDWMMLNTDGFSYGCGGASAYADALERYIDVYSPTNPQQGFVNLYSLTGDEEDRAELLAYILTDFERPMLLSLIKRDDILKKKIEALTTLLHKFSGEPFLVFP